MKKNRPWNEAEPRVPSGVSSGSIVRREPDGSCKYIADEVAVEEPLEIRIGNKPLTVTMRTPGNDEELAAGILVSEGILRSRADLLEVVPCGLPEAQGNVMNVSLARGAKFDRDAARHFGAVSSSCGICGKTSIAAIRGQFPAIDDAGKMRVKIPALLQLPEQLRAAQNNFARTGGIHAAALFDAEGNLCALREDIGRHNAVDKVIGRAYLDGLLPLKRHLLMVSGRLSFEIVQKALAAGIPILAAVSAPSTLAVNFARENGQTLIGFLRPPTFNVYSHLERLVFEGA